MKTISKLARWTLGACAAASVLAGCGGSPVQSVLPGPIGQDVRNGVTPDNGRSWMAPEAKHDDLVYVSDTGANAVSVYGLRTHKLLGMLTGINAPWGICADQSGNVWILGWKKDKIFEYAHAGTKPLQVLTVQDSEASLVDCSVDPTTGDLAVTNWGYDWYQGYLLIYPHGWGTPRTYTLPNVWYYYGCSYDDKGNLFADGWDAYLGDTFALAELTKAGRMKGVTLLPNLKPVLLGAVRWDGQYVAIANAGFIFKYAVQGHYAYYRGFTSLTSHWSPIGLFWITNVGGSQKILAPDHLGNDAAVQLWNYPAGGKPTATISDRIDEPFGVTVSLAAR